MIALVALVGLITGYLLHLASDLMPRLAGHQDEPADSITTSGASDCIGMLRVGRKIRPWALLDGAAELSTAAMFVALWLYSGPDEHTVLIAVAYSFLLLVTLIDIKYHLVLNILIYPAILAALLAVLLAVPDRLLASLLGGALAFAIFFGTSLLRPGDLGGGDVKLAALIGLTFGFPQVLWTLLLGAGLGGIVAASVIVCRRGAGMQRIPYAPFLCAGAMAYLLINTTPLMLR